MFIEDHNTKYFLEFVECIRHLDNKIPIKFQSGTEKLIFQTEQLTRRCFYNMILKFSFESVLMDYSMYNIHLINLVNKQAKCILCPIFYTEEMRFNVDKKYDFVFIGHLSQRRQQILNELLKYGFNMLIIQNEFDFRKKYELICSAKCLVNVHAYENYNVFEFARCSIPIYNNVKVVSEVCDGIDLEKQNPANKFVLERTVFAEFDQIVMSCVEALKSDVKPIDYEELNRLREEEIKRINTELKAYDC